MFTNVMLFINDHSNQVVISRIPFERKLLLRLCWFMFKRLQKHELRIIKALDKNIRRTKTDEISA